MTREEAIKVIVRNINKLNGPMQMAVKTILQEGEKIQAVKEVLTKRKGMLDKDLEESKKFFLTDEWFDGKKCGYADALELLNSTIESIREEL